MSQRNPALLPDYETVRRLFDYDAHTGSLTWRVNRPGRARKGDEAGAIRRRADGTPSGLTVGVDGVIHSAARIVWFWNKGAWPQGKLYFRDNDPLNLRLSNLADGPLNPSRRKSAVYQRELRRLNKRAAQVMREDDYLFRLYTEGTHYDQLRARRMARAAVRDREP